MKAISFLMLALAACLRLCATTVAAEGAWCWFADPRALHIATPDGRTDVTVIGYIDTHGSIKAAQFDFRNHRRTDVLVRSAFQPDDHNNPTFLRLPDNRIMVFYTRHTDEPCIYYRISQLPADISTLGPEHRLATADNTTYPSPFILEADPEHIYLCWRGINWHPTLARLTMPDADGNASFDFGPVQLVQSTGARPYAKYASNGVDRIGMAFTTGHPDNEQPNHIFYSEIDIPSMTLRSADGTLLGAIADGPLKVGAGNATVDENPAIVADGSPYRNWVWQLAFDRQQRPVIASVRISPDKKSHNYYVTRRTENGWQSAHVAYAGTHFHQSPDIEHCYSGGIAIDPADVSVLYCSVPVAAAGGTVYEIMRYTLDGNLEVKTATPVTRNSTKNCIRPYVIPGSTGSPMTLAWMAGDYFDWIVSAERPQGFPTAIETDLSAFNQDIYHLLPGAGQAADSVTFVWRRGDAEKHTFRLGKLKFSLQVDPRELYPTITVGKNAFPSCNRLATSDSWRTAPRATDGKWHPAVPLDSARFTFTVADGMLRSSVDGFADQAIPVPGAGTETTEIFEVRNPDFSTSPFTGLTRRHWLEAAEYLLSGAFNSLEAPDAPMYFPKQHAKTYPRDPGAEKVAKLEGLARTLFIAAPLLREKPDLTLNGIGVADYYRRMIAGLVDPASPQFEPHRPGGPSQTLLELGSICMSMEIAHEHLWDRFSPAQRDSLAALLKSYGEGPTIGSNWRFFNVFILSFLKEHGYEIDESYLLANLHELLKLYRGEGWYNDAPAYDYYSMWAFQTYGPLWAYLYGNRQFPAEAAQFIANQRDMTENYPYMFARDGRMNMWGRSIPYRFACTAPFGLVELTGNQDANFGWMRRIASASLLQFLQSPDFLEDGIPTLGFYGPFAPAVQIYSCRGSVYWMGKAFFSLLLPEDSRYWSATENEGPWESDMHPGMVYHHFQPATNLLITNYPDCGGSEMRSWCKETVAADWQKFRSSENYNKLAYHTEFPWMADAPEGVASMNYATRTAATDWQVLTLYDFDSFDDGIYRRSAVLEADSNTRYQLADIPLPGGLLRVDKITTTLPASVKFGSYSLPQLRQSLSSHTSGEARIIGNGQYSIAVLPLHGWDSTSVETPCGVHPQSDRCALVVNQAEVSGSRIFVTLQLWQKGSANFSPDLLATVKSVTVAPDNSRVDILFADGTSKTLTFP